MNYVICNEPMNECTCAPEHIESLTDMMKNTSMIANDVLAMTHRINSHLFGIGNNCCEKETEPKCFREELVKTKCELIATAEELQKMCSMLGV